MWRTTSAHSAFLVQAGLRDDILFCKEAVMFKAEAERIARERASRAAARKSIAWKGAMLVVLAGALMAVKLPFWALAGAIASALLLGLACGSEILKYRKDLNTVRSGLRLLEDMPSGPRNASQGRLPCRRDQTSSQIDATSVAVDAWSRYLRYRSLANSPEAAHLPSHFGEIAVELARRYGNDWLLRLYCEFSPEVLASIIKNGLSELARAGVQLDELTIPPDLTAMSFLHSCLYRRFCRETAGLKRDRKSTRLN